MLHHPSNPRATATLFHTAPRQLCERTLIGSLYRAITCNGECPANLCDCLVAATSCCMPHAAAAACCTPPLLHATAHDLHRPQAWFTAEK